ncbi:MAG: bifunctional 2-C-methyl-D-erythritol 4-phosphate cytidylyltransferase/2-C-methyl-D-erythritol 2,4-cyclodiphosphate synthase [Alphaproteobacteria bacterium]|nr:bifunctional 2-C-methyl-D-erythritol 4-phosphate cytidylyltransferase/2-C-methyl-D-erythritol 2,4-cyclodiphosphate synthase [Hyphomonas sp.]MBR9805705.1 bifunctional 2-C-methyl-D-erythritol 4-phosphate cytidylyltransferase/2-C-methyl-D-erythritol 2,4-cyclodiphosphate synthase [Alphaproteobacteria bacterium]|tara:strand:+ start:5913 stop:7049 length:1137 start_codon:yes stop_codon:yes gene_type:complete
MRNTIAIIVAAGQGRRAETALPKQWQMLNGKPVISWSIEAFISHPQVDEVIVVTSADIPENVDLSGVKLAKGGETRTLSVRSGLDAILSPADDTAVLIHDAARPGLTHQIIDELLAALKTSDAAAPALPVQDALKRQNGNALETVSRDALYRVQTPQAFAYGTISKALESATDLVDDLAAVEALGATVALVKGSDRLHKITYAEDFDMVSRLMNSSLAPIRMGSGFDVHAFEPGDHVTLCGVKIPHSARLKGHSDADAAWHALTDAILGAVALGDIGDHFPPSDDRWKDADSGIFLKAAQSLALDAGYAIANCDITVICEAPKVKPHREAMRLRTAELLGLPLDAVSVKATTTEGLGFTGRREGIAAEAVVSLVRTEG